MNIWPARDCKRGRFALICATSRSTSSGCTISEIWKLARNQKNSKIFLHLLQDSNRVYFKAAHHKLQELFYFPKHNLCLSYGVNRLYTVHRYFIDHLFLCIVWTVLHMCTVRFRITVTLHVFLAFQTQWVNFLHINLSNLCTYIINFTTMPLHHIPSIVSILLLYYYTLPCTIKWNAGRIYKAETLFLNWRYLNKLISFCIKLFE